MITPNSKRIVIADDHVCVREGLIQIIESCEPLEVIAAVENGKRLVEAVAHYEPELVITDIRMPDMDGLEAAAVIMEKYPTTSIIAYVSDESDYLFMNMLEAGFDGIVLKRASKKETVMVINMVLNGYGGFCNAGQERVNQLVRREIYNPKRGTVKAFFSEREIAVLQGICAGQTSKKIAESIHLSERTIESYRENLLRKTGAQNSAGLVSYAFLAGIVQPGLTEE